jgi:hypothetical protein
MRAFEKLLKLVSLHGVGDFVLLRNELSPRWLWLHSEISEFQSTLIIPLFIITATIVTLVFKRRQFKTIN